MISNYELVSFVCPTTSLSRGRVNFRFGKRILFPLALSLYIYIFIAFYFKLIRTNSRLAAPVLPQQELVALHRRDLRDFSHLSPSSICRLSFISKSAAAADYYYSSIVCKARVESLLASLCRPVLELASAQFIISERQMSCLMELSVSCCFEKAALRELFSGYSVNSQTQLESSLQRTNAAAREVSKQTNEQRNNAG